MKQPKIRVSFFILFAVRKENDEMDYSIRVFKVDKEDSSLRGFVSLTFEGEYCVKSIALKQSGKGNFYLEMPKYQDYETKEYLPYFDFKDSEFRKRVTEQAVEAYANIEDRYIDQAGKWGDEELYYDLGVTLEKGNRTFKAEAVMKIQDVFVVWKMHIIQGWKGKTFVGMPQRMNTNSGEKEDIAHPVTGDFKKELEGAVMDLYHKKVEYQRQICNQQNRQK